VSACLWFRDVKGISFTRFGCVQRILLMHIDILLVGASVAEEAAPEAQHVFASGLVRRPLCPVTLPPKSRVAGRCPPRSGPLGVPRASPSPSGVRRGPIRLVLVVSSFPCPVRSRQRTPRIQTDTCRIQSSHQRGSWRRTAASRSSFTYPQPPQPGPPYWRTRPAGNPSSWPLPATPSGTLTEELSCRP
jgi:hypothetical protein